MAEGMTTLTTIHLTHTTLLTTSPLELYTVTTTHLVVAIPLLLPFPHPLLGPTTSVTSMRGVSSMTHTLPPHVTMSRILMSDGFPHSLSGHFLPPLLPVITGSAAHWLAGLHPHLPLPAMPEGVPGEILLVAALCPLLPLCAMLWAQALIRMITLRRSTPMVLVGATKGTFWKKKSVEDVVYEYVGNECAVF